MFLRIALIPTLALLLLCAALLTACDGGGGAPPAGQSAPPPRVAPTTPGTVTLVSDSGSQVLGTIAEAVAAASDGDRITLSPGTYAETLVVDRGIEIMGEEGAETVVIASETGPPMLVTSPGVTVQGLSLRCNVREFDRTNDFAALAVSAEAFTARDCHLTSTAYPGLVVMGISANAQITGVHVTGCGYTGAQVHDGASASFDGCEFIDNQRGGILVSDAGSLSAVHTRVLGTRNGKGIIVQEGSTAEIVSCEIDGSHRANIGIHSGARARITDCRISRSGNANVFIEGAGAQATVVSCELWSSSAPNLGVGPGGVGEAQGCDIHDGNDSGIIVYSGGRLSARDCDIHDNQHGITLQDNSFGTFEDCVIWGNRRSGVYNYRSNPVFRRCVIRHGHWNGISSVMYGEDLYEDCEIYANAGNGVKLVACADPTFVRCRIYNSGLNGVYFESLGRGNFIDCEIFENVGHGALSQGTAYPVFRRTVLRDNWQGGLLAMGESHPGFQECEFRGNQGAGATVIESATPTFRACTFTGNGTVGFSAQTDCTATLQGCDLTGNALASLCLERGHKVRVTDCQLSDPANHGFGDRRSFVIDAAGGGDFSRIMHAAHLIPPGSTLTVRPGDYWEAVLLTRPLAIVGEGPRDGIVLRQASTHTVECRAVSAELRGLTILNEAGLVHPGNERWFSALNVRAGNVLVDSCDLSASGGAVVEGARQCALEIRGSRIHDAPWGAGVYVHSGATATVTDCQIERCLHSGVTAQDGSSASVSGCQIHECNSQAVTAYRNSRLTVIDSDLRDNQPAATFADETSTVTHSGCQM